MILIDTHTHLFVEQFDADRSEMVERAINSGVKYLFLPNIDSRTISAMHELEANFPNNCFAMMGLHPCSVKENYESELAIIRSHLERRSYSAIGEMGIDLYWDQTFIEEQKDAFLRQCEWAVEFDLPIVIHSRESTQLCIELLQNLAEADRPRGVFHCFGGTVEQANQIKALGFYLGIGGVVTYKKSGLSALIREIGLEMLVLETDSPYLAPHPHRGKRNESHFIHQIAAKVASILEIEMLEVAEVTRINSMELFSKSFDHQGNKTEIGSV